MRHHLDQVQERKFLLGSIPVQLYNYMHNDSRTSKRESGRDSVSQHSLNPGWPGRAWNPAGQALCWIPGSGFWRQIFRYPQGGQSGRRGRSRPRLPGVPCCLRSVLPVLTSPSHALSHQGDLAHHCAPCLGGTGNACPSLACLGRCRAGRGSGHEPLLSAAPGLL